MYISTCIHVLMYMYTCTVCIVCNDVHVLAYPYVKIISIYFIHIPKHFSLGQYTKHPIDYPV